MPDTGLLLMEKNNCLGLGSGLSDLKATVEWLERLSERAKRYKIEERAWSDADDSGTEKWSLFFCASSENLIHTIFSMLMRRGLLLARDPRRQINV